MGAITEGAYNLANITVMDYTIKGAIQITSLSQNGDNVDIGYKLGWTMLNGHFSLAVTDYDSSHFYESPGGRRFNQDTYFAEKQEFYFDKTFTVTVKQGASLESIGFGIGWVGETTGDGVHEVGANNFAWRGNFSSDVTAPICYTAPKDFSISATSSDTNSITVKANWTEGTKSSTVTVSAGNANGTIKTIGGTTTLSNLNSNTNYSISGSLSDDKTSLSASTTCWTYPIINDPTLTRRSGFEHNTIDVSVSASVASDYDQFEYKLGNGSWTNWTTDKTHSFTGLSENTTYTVYVKMKNTSSGYESAEKSASITTWYNPLSNISVVLVNRWYWYMVIKSSYKYNGFISKFEFAVGNDEDWVDTGTTNLHSRGSTTPGWEKNLKYDTTYTCWVRITDNHGRIYQTTADFKTLDERPLYVGNELREVKLIQPDGTVKYITPNLLSVVQPNGTVVNMNKIINNDSRTEYK